MKKFTALQTLMLVKGISELSFRPMNDADYDYFAGAGADALIAEGTSVKLAMAIGEVGGVAVAPDAVLAVCTGERVELHGTDRNGDPFDYFMTLDAF